MRDLASWDLLKFMHVQRSGSKRPQSVKSLQTFFVRVLKWQLPCMKIHLMGLDIRVNKENQEAHFPILGIHCFLSKSLHRVLPKGSSMYIFRMLDWIVAEGRKG